MSNGTRQFTGKHMLAIMLGFFAVVLAANMTMVYFARHSWTGLVVENSYVASQQFNAKMAETRAQAALHERLLDVPENHVDAAFGRHLGNARPHRSRADDAKFLDHGSVLSR